jgi:hypothetical protein
MLLDKKEDAMHTRHWWFYIGLGILILLVFPKNTAAPEFRAMGATGSSLSSDPRILVPGSGQFPGLTPILRRKWGVTAT